MKRIGYILLVFACLGTWTEAQPVRGPFYPAELRVFGLLAFPQGSYAKKSEGAATLGFGVGGEYSVPFARSRSLFATTGVSFIHNPVDPAYLEDVTGGDVEANGWNHLTLLTGLRAVSSVDPGASLYAQAQLGVNLADFGDMEVRGNSSTTYLSSSPEFSFAFALGVGIRDGRFSLGVRYLDLGNPRFEITSRNQGADVKTTANQRISLVALTGGVDF